MISIKGNARACVFLEPLFLIPHTMFSGFMTLYMLELGVSKSQVGMITSLGLAVAVFFALSSAYITDKLGRKNSSLIFDTIGWGAALLIWALAKNVYFFAAAAIVNAAGRVVMNSWHCLMLEDSPPPVRVHIFNFLQIAGILGGFFTPVGALLISRLSLVPAMRVMLIFGLVSMLALFIIRHLLVTETAIGRQKQLEMKGVGAFSVIKSYIPALKRIFANKLLVIALLLRALNFIQVTIRNTFLAVLVTEGLGFPPEALALFQTLIAGVTLAALVFITPILSRFTSRWPISLGIWLHVAATAILLLSPPSSNYPLLIAGAVLLALGTSISSPRIDALLANMIENEDRSVVNAITSVVLLLISTPFGYISGVLSEIDSRYPFLLMTFMFLICLALLHSASRYEKKLGKLDPDAR